MEENQIQIPEGWRKVALGKVLRYAQPYRFIVKSTNYDAKSGTPVLTAGKSFILGYTNEADNIYSETPVIIFDDFTTDTKFVDFPFKVKSSAMKFLKAVDEKEIDLKYAFEKIQTIKITETGGDHKRRWISEYSKIEVLLPEFTEQQSIADILSKTDQAIAHTEALIAKYTQIKTGLMQDLLTKGIDEKGNIRSEQTHEFKDSPLGRIPKEWECYLFKEIIQNFDSGWSPNCEAKPASINEWGSLKTTSITWDGYNSDENKRLPLNLNPNPKLEVQFDDILITRVGPRERVGVVVHVNDYREKLMISDNMLRLKIIPSSNIFLPFLPLMLGSTSIQKDFKNKIAGLAEAQVVINQQSIKSTFIFMPKKNEQEQIYLKNKKMNELIIVENKKLSKLQSLKTGLMQDLLSGKVRVNNL